MSRLSFIPNTKCHKKIVTWRHKSLEAHKWMTSFIDNPSECPDPFRTANAWAAMSHYLKRRNLPFRRNCLWPRQPRTWQLRPQRNARRRCRTRVGRAGTWSPWRPSVMMTSHRNLNHRQRLQPCSSCWSSDCGGEPWRWQPRVNSVPMRWNPLPGREPLAPWWWPSCCRSSRSRGCHRRAAWGRWTASWSPSPCWSRWLRWSGAVHVCAI